MGLRLRLGLDRQLSTSMVRYRTGIQERLAGRSFSEAATVLIWQGSGQGFRLSHSPRSRSSAANKSPPPCPPAASPSSSSDPSRWSTVTETRGGVLGDRRGGEELGEGGSTRTWSWAGGDGLVVLPLASEPAAEGTGLGGVAEGEAEPSAGGLGDGPASAGVGQHD